MSQQKACCPECGSMVENLDYTLECDHCLSKKAE